MQIKLQKLTRLGVANTLAYLISFTSFGTVSAAARSPADAPAQSGLTLTFPLLAAFLLQRIVPRGSRQHFASTSLNNLHETKGPDAEAGNKVTDRCPRGADGR